MRKSAAGERAKELLREFPKHASQTIAKRLSEELDISLSHARDAVRYHRGERAGGPRRTVANPIAKRSPEEAKAAMAWAAMPVPVESDFHFVSMPPEPKLWLVIADLHVPFHDLKACITALKYGQDRGVDGVLILGDGLDFYGLSDFCKDPRLPTMADEIKAMRTILEIIYENLKPKKLLYREANHEARLYRYMFQRAPALVDLLDGLEDGGNPLGLETLLHLHKFNGQLIRDKNPLVLDDLNLLHGDEYGGKYVPVNPARGMALKAKACVLSAHHHQTSEQPIKDLRGRLNYCWSIGCLADLHPNYKPLNDWNHGFALIHNDSNGWEIENKRIVKGLVR